MATHIENLKPGDYFLLLDHDYSNDRRESDEEIRPVDGVPYLVRAITNSRFILATYGNSKDPRFIDIKHCRVQKIFDIEYVKQFATLENRFQQELDRKMEKTPESKNSWQTIFRI